MRLVKCNTDSGERLSSAMESLEAWIQREVPMMTRERVRLHGETEASAKEYALSVATRLLRRALRYHAETAVVKEVIDPELARAANSEKGAMG